MPRRLAPSVSEAQNQGARFSPQASETRMRRITHVAVLAALVAASATSRHCPTRWPRQRFHRWPRRGIHTDQGAQVHDRRGHLAEPRSVVRWTDDRLRAPRRPLHAADRRGPARRRASLSGQAYDAMPHFSPDGKHVAFGERPLGAPTTSGSRTPTARVPRQLPRDNNNIHFQSPTDHPSLHGSTSSSRRATTCGIPYYAQGAAGGLRLMGQTAAARGGAAAGGRVGSGAERLPWTHRHARRPLHLYGG